MADKPTFDLKAFHAGERETLREVYRAHVSRVERSVSRYCRGADAECITHEVFLALMGRQEVSLLLLGQAGQVVAETDAGIEAPFIGGLSVGLELGL